MIGGYSYAWEKLYLTVRALAEVDATVQERLGVAWENSGARLRIDPDLYFPDPELRTEFQQIHAALTSATVETGSIRATTTNMSAEDASKLAGRIVGLFHDVCRLHYAKD